MKMNYDKIVSKIVKICLNREYNWVCIWDHARTEHKRKSIKVFLSFILSIHFLVGKNVTIVLSKIICQFIINFRWYFEQIVIRYARLFSYTQRKTTMKLIRLNKYKGVILTFNRAPIAIMFQIIAWHLLSQQIQMKHNLP